MAKLKWRGRTAAVLASGPSLTKADAKAARDAGCITVAVNNTWMLAPWCDVLYAGDARWWRAYGDDVNIPAKRYARNSEPTRSGHAMYRKTAMKGSYNSGQLAIEVAITNGADLIILLGFDVSLKHGIHHHGPHTKTPDPVQGRMRIWHKQFAQIPRTYPNANIVNCSRYTELTCFPIEPLEDVLARLPSPPPRSP